MPKTTKELLADTEGHNLPLPRLQLVWEDQGADDRDGVTAYTAVCHYLLVIPVDRYDCRNLAGPDRFGEQGYTAAPMGTTKCRSASPWLERLDLDIPFRDGAHILWDSRRLGFPAYVSCGERFRQLDTSPRNPGEEGR